jgi:hypothetical protein
MVSRNAEIPITRRDEMAETANPAKSQKPHGLDWRPVVNDYRAKAGRSGAVDIDSADAAAMDSTPVPDENEHATESPINLRKFQEQLNRSRLDDIAALVLSLTYGEMIEMANAIWNVQPDGAAITQDNLPALLHRWSKSRSTGDTPGAHSD